MVPAPIGPVVLHVVSRQPLKTAQGQPEDSDTTCICQCSSPLSATLLAACRARAGFCQAAAVSSGSTVPAVHWQPYHQPRGLKPVDAFTPQALIQFLLDYPVGAARLRRHLAFLLTNLAYEHEVRQPCKFFFVIASDHDLTTAIEL